MANVVSFQDKGAAQKERDLKNKESALKVWRRTLKNEPQTAAQAVKRALGLMMRAKFHYSDIARYNAQMLNGVAHPGEFGFNDETGLYKRA
jgi:hypothetical protein